MAALFLTKFLRNSIFKLQFLPTLCTCQQHITRRNKSLKAYSQGSYASLEKNRLMKKFLDKRKKKGWYDSPTYLYGDVTNKERKGSSNNVNPSSMKRINNLSQLFHRHITQIISSGELDPKLAELGVQISRVRLASDMSGVNVWWVTSGTEIDHEVEQLLFKLASPLRQILMTDHLGHVPSINFVKDDHAYMVAEVEKLLETADIGEENTEMNEDHTSLDSGFSGTVTRRDNVYGLDHAALMAKLESGPKIADFGGVNFDPSDSSVQLKLRKNIRIPSALRQKPLVHGDAEEYLREQQFSDAIREMDKFEAGIDDDLVLLRQKPLVHGDAEEYLREQQFSDAIREMDKFEAGMDDERW